MTNAGPTLLRDRRGAGTLQMLILAVGLALGGIGAAKALSSAAGKRSDCAGEEIQAMGPKPCSSGNAGGQGSAQPAPPPPAPKQDKQPEKFDPQKELLNILADILGITDAKKCFTEGDILACVMTFANFSPFKLLGTALKVVKNIPKIKRAIEALNAFRKAEKAEEDARKAEKAAREAKEARDAAAAGKNCKNGKCDKPKQCFAAGTPVETASGPVAIEALQPGDLVWSRDDESGEEGYRPIARVFVTPEQPLLTVALEDESGAIETIDTTAPHPFQVEGRGWVPAGELEPGDQVESADGGDLEVASTEDSGRVETVYNFEVEEFHTYFVGEGAAWVHNDCEKTPEEIEKLKGELDDIEKQLKDKSLSGKQKRDLRARKKEIKDELGEGADDAAGATAAQVDKKLGDLKDIRDMDAAEAIRSRGGNASNVRKALGDKLRGKTVGEIAEMAANGDESAETALKIIKQAFEKGQTH
jgi:hypothetical protein